MDQGEERRKFPAGSITPVTMNKWTLYSKFVQPKDENETRLYAR
jgi:hypothetical protein